MRNPGRGFRSRKTASGSNRQRVLCWLIQSIEEPNTPYCRTNSRHKSKEKKNRPAAVKSFPVRPSKKPFRRPFGWPFFFRDFPGSLISFKISFFMPGFLLFQTHGVCRHTLENTRFSFLPYGYLFFSLQHSPAFSPAAHCAS